MIEVRRYSAITGLLGILCIASFWLALLVPERTDALLRPFGLYVWFGLSLCAVILPTVAALAGSKRWLIVTALGIVTLVKFFLGVSS